MLCRKTDMLKIVYVYSKRSDIVRYKTVCISYCEIAYSFNYSFVHVTNVWFGDCHSGGTLSTRQAAVYAHFKPMHAVARHGYVLTVQSIIR